MVTASARIIAMRRLDKALLLGCILVICGPASAQNTPAAPALAAAGEAAADLAPVEVDAEGSGPTRQAAIDRALSAALEQATGVSVLTTSITSNLDLTGRGAMRANSASSADAASMIAAPPAKTDSRHASLDIDAATNESKVVKASIGHIASYTIISVEPELGGGFTAKIHAQLEIVKRRTTAADLRRRVTVSDFVSERGDGMADTLHNQLLMDLTQSRRFTVVDRSHDNDYQHEMALVGSAEASSAERQRAGQVLGADYMLTGKLRVVGSRTTGASAVTTYTTLDLTGEVVGNTTASTLRTTAGSMSAEFELIEVATRQIVLADRLTVSGDNIDAVAQFITDNIVNTIYPPRLIKFDDPNALIISQGGSGMNVGKRFKVMLQGTELFDPYTNESLGKTDQEIATIEVSDVRPKISYARLIAGQIPLAGGEMILHADQTVSVPIEPTVPARRKSGHVRAAVAVSSERDAGVRLPFDH